MTNVLLTSMGTNGDVIPFVRVGSALRERGHRATLISHCFFGEIAERAGIEFAAVDTPDTYQEYIVDGPLSNTPLGIPLFFRKQVLPKLLTEYELLRERCVPGETIVVTSANPGIAARLLAEKLGVPFTIIIPAPSYMATMNFFEELVGGVLGGEVNAIRAALDLPPVTDWHDWLKYPDPSIGLWPDWFGAADPAWPEVRLTGFAWHNEPDAGPIPDDVLRFIEAGEPPILLTAGTGMFLGRQWFKVCAEACRLLGHRGLLVTRHDAMVPHPLPDEVTWFRYLPSLEKVMPYMSAIVHHGGMGSLNQALAAGIPQLILAAGYDRPDNASKLKSYGVADWLPPSRSQPDVIAGVLERLIHSEQVRAECRRLAGMVAQSDGVSAACDLIETLAPAAKTL